jgi:hypothetical protein
MNLPIVHMDQATHTEHTLKNIEVKEYLDAISVYKRKQSTVIKLFAKNSSH